MGQRRRGTAACRRRRPGAARPTNGAAACIPALRLSTPALASRPHVQAEIITCLADCVAEIGVSGRVLTLHMAPGSRQRAWRHGCGRPLPVARPAALARHRGLASAITRGALCTACGRGMHPCDIDSALDSSACQGYKRPCSPLAPARPSTTTNDTTHTNTATATRTRLGARTLSTRVPQTASGTSSWRCGPASRGRATESRAGRTSVAPSSGACSRSDLKHAGMMAAAVGAGRWQRGRLCSRRLPQPRRSQRPPPLDLSLTVLLHPTLPCPLRAPQADLYADGIIFRRLRACSAAESASSEETTDIVPLEGRGYSVRGGALARDRGVL